MATGTRWEISGIAKRSNSKHWQCIYLEGSGFCSIGRLLNCSHVAVYQRIKQYGERGCLDALPTTELDVVEMDEMQSYAGSKNAGRLWIAVDRLGHRFLNVIVCLDIFWPSDAVNPNVILSP